MATQVVPAIPFTAAAHEHTEKAFDWRNITLGTDQLEREFDIPSAGYARHIVIHVKGTGGSGGNAKPDAPWNILREIVLNDTNSAPVFGPIDGYSALWANIAGGYANMQDPRFAPEYKSTSPNFEFMLRIPLEISHFDGLGSIANQNAAAPYRVKLTLARLADVFATAPSTNPTFTITGWLEAWSVPTAADVMGRPQAQAPPAHGTTQFWSNRQEDVAVGDNVVDIKRVGSLIRNVVFIARDASGVRSDAVFPDPIRINWDQRQIFQESQAYRKRVTWERLNDTTIDTGVFIYSYAHSVGNRSGDDTPNMWIATVPSSRLELAGPVATAGRIQVIVNDIAPFEQNQADRYIERSQTGYTPMVGTAAGAPVQ